jgi:prepilin-type N-terminal cleavage/methylation domain-containing protein
MTFSRTRHYDTGWRGFTLAEAMIATVVLGIAAAGVLLPFTSGATARAEGMRGTLGAKLASDLMEEIVNTPFEQIVAGYNYSEPQGQVKDAAKMVFTDPMYANFSRKVSCVNVDVPVSPGGFSKDVGFIHATVWVYYSGKEIAAINRLVSE